MPLQTLNWGPTPGSQVATGLGAGLSEGMQALANMKMKQYAQRQQATKNEQFFNSLPGMTPEKAKAYANASPEMQQLGVKELFNAPYNQAFAQASGKILSGQAKPEELSQLFTQMRPEQALKLAQFQQQQETNKIALGQKKEEEGRKERKLELEESEKIGPFIKSEQEVSKNIGDVGKDARRIKQILERHKKDWPSWVGGLAHDLFGGKTLRNPEMRELYKLTSALPVKLGNVLKGQPTNMKVKLVAEGKPDISSPWETNMQLIQTLIDASDEDRTRTLFRTKQKKNNKYPVDIDQKMADYDAAINNPEEYPEFFEKYPKFSPKTKGTTPQKAATQEIKVGSKLDHLPPASEYPGMEGMWNGQKVKSDGKSWRKV